MPSLNIRKVGDGPRCYAVWLDHWPVFLDGLDGLPHIGKGEKVPGTVFRCCLMVAGLQLRSSSYAVTRRGDLACPGVGLDQGVEKAGVQGPASLLRSYAVTSVVRNTVLSEAW